MISVNPPLKNQNIQLTVQPSWGMELTAHYGVGLPELVTESDFFSRMRTWSLPVWLSNNTKKQDLCKLFLYLFLCLECFTVFQPWQLKAQCKIPKKWKQTTFSILMLLCSLFQSLNPCLGQIESSRMCIKTIPNLPTSFCPPSIDITMGFIHITCWHLDSAHYISGSQNLNLSSVIVKGTIEIHVWIKARRGSQHPTTITIIWKLALVSLHAVPQRDTSEMLSYMPLLTSTGSEPSSPKPSLYMGMNPWSGSSSFPASLFPYYNFVNGNLQESYQSCYGIGDPSQSSQSN